jgi:hypothetical protein
MTEPSKRAFAMADKLADAEPRNKRNLYERSVVAFARRLDLDHILAAGITADRGEGQTRSLSDSELAELKSLMLPDEPDPLKKIIYDLGGSKNAEWLHAKLLEAGWSPPA